MSSSTKSKAASASSPATGGETKGDAEADPADKADAKADKADAKADKADAKPSIKAEKPSKEGRAGSKADRADAKTDKAGSRTKSKNDSSGRRDVIEIELEHSRQREIAWTIGGLLGGVLLIAKLGTVGVWGGYALIIYGLYKAYLLVMSFVNPPGTIVVTDNKVVLPRGLYRGKPVEVTPSQVTAVYFLRRSVPWNRSSPVLVVELGEKAMIFPRDWFSAEADQRHIVHALLGHLRPATTAAASE